MTTGTKSLLFGVHQFLWHPVTVALAWRKLYHRWPSFWECVSIFVHDWGYWGCEKMDDARGEEHPHFGANIVLKLHSRRGHRRWHFYYLVLLHSRYLSAKLGQTPSDLCWADKLSMKYDPRWFYLFRARLSGEIREYRLNNLTRFSSDRQWFDWICSKAERDAVLRIPAAPRRHDRVMPIRLVRKTTDGQKVG